MSSRDQRWKQESLPPGHGHTLIERLMPEIVARGGQGYLVEIGSTREKQVGQDSTIILGTLAARLGLPFVTVDMDPANTEQASADLQSLPQAEAVTARGEDYLANFDGRILAAYLDAFDIQHGKHSGYRKERYRLFLGTEITNEASSAMHLACAKAIVPRLATGGLIVIDDTWADGDGFAGKGREAVPALLGSGFRVVARTQTAVALQHFSRLALLRRRLRRMARWVRRELGTSPAQRKARVRAWRRDTGPRLSYRFYRDGRRSMRALHALRDTAPQRRCVIIGNGPSLNRTDLSLLANEPTFCLNRGYLLFPRLGGPSTYLVSVNRFVLAQSGTEMLASPCLKFFSWRHRRHVPAGRDDVIFVRTEPAPVFSTNVPRDGLWEGATVTFVAMQLAYHMGYRDIVLVGVDHSFTSAGPAHKVVTSTGDDPNHFDPNYFGAGYRWQLPDLELSERAYALARAAFEAAGGSVVDATVDGKLTIFPKAELSELFPAASAELRP